jgi:hypothetical protein
MTDMDTQVNIINFLIDISSSMERKIDGETFQRAIRICEELVSCFPQATKNYYLIYAQEQHKGLTAGNLREVETRFNARDKVSHTSDIAVRINNVLQTTITSATQQPETKTLLFVLSDGDDTASTDAFLKNCRKSELQDLRGRLHTTVVYFDKFIQIPNALYFNGKQKYKNKNDLNLAVRQYVIEMLHVAVALKQIEDNEQEAREQVEEMEEVDLR